MNPYDTVLEADLARKVADDITGYIKRSVALADTQRAGVVIATAALGAVVGALADLVFADVTDFNDEAVDKIWNQLARQLAISALSDERRNRQAEKPKTNYGAK